MWATFNDSDLKYLKYAKDACFQSSAVRMGSKHNIRASILASSLCLESAFRRSMAGSVAGSVSGSTRRTAGKKLMEPAAVHSSSGISSGGSSSDDVKSVSPTPSSNSSEDTVIKTEVNGSKVTSGLDRQQNATILGNGKHTPTGNGYKSKQ